MNVIHLLLCMFMFTLVHICMVYCFICWSHPNNKYLAQFASMLYHIGYSDDAFSRFHHRRRRHRCYCSSCGSVILRTEYIQCKICFEGIKDGIKDQTAYNHFIVCTVHTTKPTQKEEGTILANKENLQ